MIIKQITTTKLSHSYGKSQREEEHCRQQYYWQQFAAYLKSLLFLFSKLPKSQQQKQVKSEAYARINSIAEQSKSQCTQVAERLCQQTSLATTNSKSLTNVACCMCRRQMPQVHC